MCRERRERGEEKGKEMKNARTGKWCFYYFPIPRPPLKGLDMLFLFCCLFLSVRVVRTVTLNGADTAFDWILLLYTRTDQGRVLLQSTQCNFVPGSGDILFMNKTSLLHACHVPVVLAALSKRFYQLQ
jgi:hypothetical protein